MTNPDLTTLIAELRERVAELEAELDALRQPVDDAEIAEIEREHKSLYAKRLHFDNLHTAHRHRGILLRAYRQVSADNAKLREYVQHRKDCGINKQVIWSEKVCTCGLAELLENG